MGRGTYPSLTLNFELFEAEESVFLREAIVGYRFGGEVWARGREFANRWDRKTQAILGARRLGLIGSLAVDDRRDGLGQNLEIEPRGPVVDVVQIHLHPLLKGQG